jgi:hypothetical protein
MLLRVLPEQVSTNWDWIKFSLIETTPELTERGLNVILENLLCESMQCWWEVEENNGVIKLYAIIVTSLFQDNFFQANCLRICSLYGYDDLSEKQWKEGFESLLTFAKGSGCSRIEAFSDREYIPDMAKKFGFNVAYHISLEV